MALAWQSIHDDIPTLAMVALAGEKQGMQIPAGATHQRQSFSRSGGPSLIQAGDVLVHLRRCGIVTHHAATMTSTADGRYRTLVVFLERSLNQHELAEECARKLSGVIKVEFSGHSRSIMFVTSETR